MFNKILKETAEAMLTDKMIIELGKIKTAVRTGKKPIDLYIMVESLQDELEGSFKND